MDKRINWGILSTAKINPALIKPLRGSKRTELLAVASRSQSSADAYAREWKIPRAYGTYDELLSDPDIDVIYNPLPNNMHTEWTVKAMRAGKHVLCEKPLALTLAEVDEIIAVSKETGKVVTEAFMYRHHPQTLKVQEIVASGVLGKLQLIKGSFTFTLNRKGNYRFVKEMGGGSIWDVGCYPISYARMVVGEEPVEVFGWQVLGQDGADDTFVGQMKFSNGVLAQFDSSFILPPRKFMEIVGREGILKIPNPFNPRGKCEIILSKDGVDKTINFKNVDLYSGEVEDMCNAVEFGNKPRVSLDDSRGNAAVILSLIGSAETKKPVIMQPPYS